jgi:teichuronic acid biosynthesis glycosyltransferase TuaG
MKVGTIIALYNSQSYIVDLLDSIIKQSYPIDEVILVDDCSRDDTFNVVTEYIKNLSHVNSSVFRLVRCDINSGVSSSFNLGLNLFSSDILLCTGHDDIWLPNRIKMSMMAINAGHDFIYSSFRKFGDASGLVSAYKDSVDVALKMITNNCIGAITVGLNIKNIGKNNILFESKFDGAEDFKVWTNLISDGYEPFGISDELMLYRITSGQLSQITDYSRSDLLPKIIDDYVSKIISPYAKIYLNDLRLLASENIEFLMNYDYSGYQTDRFFDLLELLSELNPKNIYSSKIQYALAYRINKILNVLNP